MLPISYANWQRLTEANRMAVQNGWAAPGVFATGIGPDYRPGGFLYVGKSAGPLAEAVGSGTDLAVSMEASTRWMIERRNLSAFWQFVDRIDRTRRSIAWTNVCKMDVRGGGRPPLGRQWQQVAESCMATLREELDVLAPKVVVFAISKAYLPDTEAMLSTMGYRRVPSHLDGDGWTTLYVAGSGRYAITTRHPQGWPSPDRDRVIDQLRSLLDQ